METPYKIYLLEGKKKVISKEFLLTLLDPSIELVSYTKSMRYIQSLIARMKLEPNLFVDYSDDHSKNYLKKQSYDFILISLNNTLNIDTAYGIILGEYNLYEPRIRLIYSISNNHAKILYDNIEKLIINYYSKIIKHMPKSIIIHTSHELLSLFRKKGYSCNGPACYMSLDSKDRIKYSVKAPKNTIARVYEKNSICNNSENGIHNIDCAKPLDTISLSSYFPDGIPSNLDTNAEIINSGADKIIKDINSVSSKLCRNVLVEDYIKKSYNFANYILVIMIQDTEEIFGYASFEIHDKYVRMRSPCSLQRDDIRGIGSVLIEIGQNITEAVGRDKIIVHSLAEPFDFYIKRGFKCDPFCVLSKKIRNSHSKLTHLPVARWIEPSIYNQSKSVRKSLRKSLHKSINSRTMTRRKLSNRFH